MNISRRCFKEFEEQNTFTRPMEELGQIFLTCVKRKNTDRHCPDCKKKIAILNLLGFDK